MCAPHIPGSRTSPPCPAPGGEPPELEQPRLVRVQRQPELSRTVREAWRGTACTSSAMVSPGSALPAPARAGPEGSLPVPARRPPTSPRPPRRRPSDRFQSPLLADGVAQRRRNDQRGCRRRGRAVDRPAAKVRSQSVSSSSSSCRIGMPSRPRDRSARLKSSRRGGVVVERDEIPSVALVEAQLSDVVVGRGEPSSSTTQLPGVVNDCVHQDAPTPGPLMVTTS